MKLFFGSTCPECLSRYVALFEVRSSSLPTTRGRSTHSVFSLGGEISYCFHDRYPSLVTCSWLICLYDSRSLQPFSTILYLPRRLISAGVGSSGRFFGFLRIASSFLLASRTFALTSSTVCFVFFNTASTYSGLAGDEVLLCLDAKFTLLL